MYFNQTWCQHAPLHHLLVYEISRQSDYLFPFYGSFNTLTKRRKKKTKKLSQFLEVDISETPGVIELKFGMWGTNNRGHLHNENRPVSYQQHEVIYARKSHYCSSCQYTHGCGMLASWAARFTIVCLDTPGILGP